MWVRQCCVRPNIAKHLFMCMSVCPLQVGGGTYESTVSQEKQDALSDGGPAHCDGPITLKVGESIAETFQNVNIILL